MDNEQQITISFNDEELGYLLTSINKGSKKLFFDQKSWINGIDNEIIKVDNNTAEKKNILTLPTGYWQTIIEILESEIKTQREPIRIYIIQILWLIRKNLQDQKDGNRHNDLLELENESQEKIQNTENILRSGLIKNDTKLDLENEPQEQKQNKENNLWSGLIKHDAKSEIFCPQDLQVTINDFFAELNTLITSNRIPVNAELCDITWDNAGVSQKRIIVAYSGNEIKQEENVVQFLIGVDEFGNYSYIEEKVILKKPDLPKYPQKIDHSDRPELSCGGLAVGLFFGIFPGLIYWAVISGHQQEYDAIVEEKDKQYKKDKKEWDLAWESWEKNVLKVIYLSNTNDIYGRFIQATSSLVKMTIKILYEDQKAEIKERIEKAFTEEQLKEELEKRKKEFK